MNNTIKNSWRVRKLLTSCRNLFQKEDRGYMAYFYHCQCGWSDVVVTAHNYTPLYCCEVCANEKFIDGYLVDKGGFNLHGADLVLSYMCMPVDNGFRSVAYIDVPIDVDFMRKKMLFTRYELAYYSLYLNGKSAKDINIDLKNIDLENTLASMIRKYIITNYEGTIPIPFQNDKEKSAAILFFLAHPHFMDFAFYYWDIAPSLPKLYKPKMPVTVEEVLYYLLNDRKERTVKHALFCKHKWLEERIKNNKISVSFTPDEYTFDPQTVFVICRCIEDPNIVSRLLMEDFVIFDNRYGYYHLEFRKSHHLYLHDLIWFIIFLKSYYTEKQIADLLLNIEADMNKWMDTLALAKHFRGTIKKVFRRVKLTVKSLHNEMIRCSEDKENRKIQNMKFSYADIYKLACSKVNDLEFKLPDTGLELSNWAQSLHNCMAGYAYTVLSKETVIYGIFRNNQIVYAVEIYKNCMEQCLGKYNQEIPVNDLELIDHWFEKSFQSS